MKISPISIRARLVAALLLSAPAALAHPYDSSHPDLSTQVTLIGLETRTDGTDVIYNIPIENWPNEITVLARGGDGGRAKATALIGSDKIGDGGGGAALNATFAVGTDSTSALKPGGELRFVVGSKGSGQTKSDIASAGGGGGTGVLYRAPTSGATWELLMLAGGGGGACAGTAAFQVFDRDGKNANITTDGDDAGSPAPGGTNGGSGRGWSGGSGGGAGWTQSADGSQGGKRWTSGGEGGVNNGSGADGGFGCGGGGGSSRDIDSNDGGGGGGGGGGGYSGGGGGNHDAANASNEGGGGGSYIDSRATAQSANERDGSDSAGIALVNPTGNSNASLSGPTITLSGSSTVTITSHSAYTDAGASAVDVYGNAITLGSDNHYIIATVNENVAGTYSYTHYVTDQFGNTSSKTRTVIVKAQTAPTFTISGNISRDENSGSASISSFVTNFNANDSGQSLSHYSLTNNNNALFSTQPAVSNSGTLTFTVAPDTFGTATVTITGYDNGDENTSTQKTFVITVNEVIPQNPTFSILGDLSRAKNSGAQSITSFAYDFNPNDSGQSLTVYVLTNDNNSLFSVQPAVDNSGTLTFTPAGTTFGTAAVTITGYDSGDVNNSSQQTFTITIEEIDPTADFSVNKTLVIAGRSVQFTDASSDAVEWEWDFDNDGTIDSTEQNPSHTYTTAGTYSVKLNVRNTSDENSIVQNDLIRVVGYGLANADGSSTDFANGSGSISNLGKGWYGKNGDNGSVATPDWSTGLTTGTPGVLTQIKNSGSATRFGQFFANNLTGNNWALSFDLGGTGKFSQVRIWGGTLASNPTGTVLTGDDSAPASGLVDANGWTSVLYQGAVSASGTVTLNIGADLGQFDVLAIQFKSSSGGIGTTYDNFAFVQQTAPVAGDDSYETLSTETVSGNVLDNDSGGGAYNDSITVTAVAGEASNIGTQVTLPSGALLTVTSDGSFTYDPNDAFDATTEDSFTYTIENGAGSTTASVTLTITVPAPLETFRTTYGLAEDGSDDDLDWSQNGVANIFYYLFGLGDPNGENIDRSLLPALTKDGDIIIFTYRSPSTSDPLVSYAVTSTDLKTWTGIEQLTGDEALVNVSTSTETDGYLRYSITIPATRQARFFSIRPQTPATE